MMRVSQKFYKALSNERFHLTYSGFTSQEEYANLVNVQMLESLGKDYTAQFEANFSDSDKPLYTFGRQLNLLMAPENLALLTAYQPTPVKHILDRAPNFEKSFVFSSYAIQFFTKELHYSRIWKIIESLAPLSVGQLYEIAPHAHLFFIGKDIDKKSARLHMVDSLTPLSVEQIHEIILQAHIFFPNDIFGSGRSEIIESLAPLSVEQISDSAQVLIDYAYLFSIEEMRVYEQGFMIAALIPLSIEQILEISSLESIFFPKDTNGLIRAQIITALQPLSVAQISEFAQAISGFGDIFFENLRAFDRAKLIGAFATLSVEKISAISVYFSTFFTEEMPVYQQAKLIEAFAPLSVDQIHEIMRDLGGQSLKNILEIIAEKSSN